MEDSRYRNVAFELVAYAGEARSLSILAPEAARNGDFRLAEAYLKDAASNLEKAHTAQKNLLANKAGEAVTMLDIVLFHAFDHLTMAELEKENAEELLHLYRKLETLKGQEKG